MGGPQFLLLALAILSLAAKNSNWDNVPVKVSAPIHINAFEIKRAGSRSVLHLDGIDTVNRRDSRLARAALLAIRLWLKQPDVKLVGTRRDASGRTLGSLQLADGSFLSERLLSNGFALYVATNFDASRAQRFQAAQIQGRNNRSGIWGKPRVLVEQIKGRHGLIATVCGNVKTVHKNDSLGHKLLFLGRTYPRHQLTVRIPINQFGQPEILDVTYLRRDLCITGRLIARHDVPEITVYHSSQIERRGGSPRFP